MADPISAGLIVSGVSTAGSMIAQSGAADAQESANRQRAQQERVAAANRSVTRQKNLLSVLSTQRSMAGGRGITPGQGSFQAVQKGAFQAFDEDERADALNTQYTENYLNSQSQIARSNANINQFNSLLNFGTNAFNSSGPRIK